MSTRPLNRNPSCPLNRYAIKKDNLFFFCGKMKFWVHVCFGKERVHCGTNTKI